MDPGRPLGAWSIRSGPEMFYPPNDRRLLNLNPDQGPLQRWCQPKGLGLGLGGLCVCVCVSGVGATYSFHQSI